uniref:Uncharacterized protein n=1 Tax=Arundo donax TaxID=35708 RepID=A0A0A9D7L3_ARUDO
MPLSRTSNLLLPLFYVDEVMLSHGHGMLCWSIWRII